MSSDDNKILISERADVAGAVVMFNEFLGTPKGERSNMPHDVLKGILAMDLEINTDTLSGDATAMELIMLKLVERGMKGDMAAIGMIIREVQHEGVSKHQYVDTLPDDVKYLYPDVTFTEDAPRGSVIEISADDVHEVIEKKEQDINELTNSWG